MGFLREAIKITVGTGAGAIAYATSKGLAAKYIPKKTGIIGAFSTISTTLASFAISEKATETMTEYVEKRYDRTVAAIRKIGEAIGAVSKNDEKEEVQNEPESEKTTESTEEGTACASN